VARFPSVSPASVGLSDTIFSALVSKARGRPGPIYPLHVGDTYLEPLLASRAEAQLTRDHPRLHNYSSIQGEPVLLDAVQNYLQRISGEVVDRECVQIMCGATAGLSVVSEALLDPGDEVLIPAPFWPLIRGIVSSRCAVPVEIPFFDQLGRPYFDAEAALETAVTRRTSALYVNTPNNPTGCVLPDPVLAAIARVARQHDLWVIADEAYRELAYDPSSTPPIWTRPDFRDRVIATHSLSKSYALAGARVGFTHGPRRAMQAIRGVQAFQTYCAPRPMQFGAARALTEGAAWLADARQRYIEAGRAAAKALGLPPPQGGTFLFFDARPHFHNGEALDGFLERCLDAGVLLTPGTACGRNYGTWVRLCFTSVPPTDLEQAVERLKRVLGHSS
jgi:N-succinyldiaminopimelate aminotransferase